MSALVAFAKEELRRLRDPGAEPDEIQDAIEENVLEIVKAFAAAGHSGSSAPYTLGILTKVLAFEPVTPLTGDDDEWHDPAGDGEILQNKRCPRVFKGRDGVAYDIEAVVFREADGSTWTTGDSSRNITFPYRPTTEIVERTGADVGA